MSNPGAMLYTQGFGSRPENVEVPHIDSRAPAATDILYPIGKRWIFTNNGEYTLLGLSTSNGITTATWSVVTTLTGAITTITGDSGGAEVPSAGNFSLLGTANQITVTGGTNKETFSIPSAFVAPGSITATIGAITATNGNLVLGTAGNKILSTSVATTIAAGANSFGTVTLVAGTATVSTTAVTSSSLVVIWRQSIGSTGAAALGQLTVGTIVNGTSFIINAALTATATSLATTDVSVVGWMIIN